MLAFPGRTEPFKVALYEVIFVAGATVGSGKTAGGAAVLKLPIGEIVSPDSLTPIALK